MNLILVNKSVDIFPNKVNDNIIVDIYRHSFNLKIIRVIRKFHLMSHLPFKGLWLNKEIKKISLYDKIIIFDTGNIEYIINFLSKKIKKNKLFLWYWGPTSISVNPNNIDKNKCSVWTFDIYDSKKYKLKVNSQFYFKENVIFSSRILYDIFFIGTEKNRLDYLLQLEKYFKSKKFKTFFYIVKSHSIYKSTKSYNYKKNIAYKETIPIIAQSKALLDVVSNEQNGLTLRPLEALFFKKKLITNFKNIEETLLYKLNKNNIFILGIDDLNTIEKFINAPFLEENYEEAVKYYSFETWVNRFE